MLLQRRTLIRRVAPPSPGGRRGKSSGTLSAIAIAFLLVIPAKAGIQCLFFGKSVVTKAKDAGFPLEARGNDEQERKGAMTSKSVMTGRGNDELSKGHHATSAPILRIIRIVHARHSPDFQQPNGWSSGNPALPAHTQGKKNPPRGGFFLVPVT
jgi:hypothetical protein